MKVPVFVLFFLGPNPSGNFANGFIIQQTSKYHTVTMITITGYNDYDDGDDDDDDGDDDGNCSMMMLMMMR